VFFAEAKLKKGVSFTASQYVETAILFYAKIVKHSNVSGVMTGKSVQNATLGYVGSAQRKANISRALNTLSIVMTASLKDTFESTQKKK